MKKFFLSLSLLLSATLAFGQTTDLQKIRLDSFGKGQNSKDFFATLQPDEAAHIENLFISNKGQAITRTGQALFLTDVGSTPFLGLGADYVDSATSYIVVASGTTVARQNTANWTQISTSSMGASHDTGFIQANNLLFAYNGTANTAWWNGSTSVWTSGGSWPTSPPTATTSAWLNNYLFLAGNSTNPDWLFVSTNLTPQTFASDQVIKINTGDGQAIKRIEPYRTGDLIIYKERSIFDLNITGLNSSCTPQPICQWTVTQLTRDIGTPAPRSVVSLGNDQWFLSSQPFAIRSLTRSESDTTFVQMNSLPIQDIFSGAGDVAINPTQIGKAAGVIFNSKYFLALSTGSSSVNDYVVVYDFLTQGWTTITGWYPKDWLVYNNNLYYTDANDGRVVQCLTGSTGDFGTSHSSTSLAAPINNDYQSRGIDFGYPENFKALDSVSFEFYPTGNFDATVSINLDNGGWQEVGTVNLAGDALTLPFTLPATLSGSGFAIETLQLQRYGEFKRMQVRAELEELSQTLTLQAMDIFARVKPWRREN